MSAGHTSGKSHGAIVRHAEVYVTADSRIQIRVAASEATLIRSPRVITLEPSNEVVIALARDLLDAQRMIEERRKAIERIDR